MLQSISLKDKAAIAAIVIGLGSNAVGTFTPLLGFQFPWRLSFFIVAIGWCLIAWGILFFLNVSFRQNLKLVALLGFGFLIYGFFFSPPPMGPCSVKLDIEGLRTTLKNAVEAGHNNPQRNVEIWVEVGNKDTCQYAKALYEAFKIGQWNPKEIQEAPRLAGNGVWFHASQQDAIAIQIYEQLWGLQPLRLDLRKDIDARQWVFWIKDTWPTPITRATSR